MQIQSFEGANRRDVERIRGKTRNLFAKQADSPQIIATGKPGLCLSSKS